MMGAAGGPAGAGGGPSPRTAGSTARMSSLYLPAALAATVLLLWLAAAPPSRTRRPSSGAARQLARCGTAATAAAVDDRSVHVVFTSNGSPYVNWQTLALYGSWRRARRMPGGEHMVHMVALTRVLHRSSDDDLSPFVPTYRVPPLRQACDALGGCPFVQADRPNAVRQFLEAAGNDSSLIRAPWLLLIEPDFVFVRPLEAPPPASGPSPALGFRYGNVAPWSAQLEPVLRKLYPPGYGSLDDLPPTGPSPLLMRPADLARLAHRWEGYTAQIEGDPEAVQKLSTVREMYAFAAAVAVERVAVQLQSPPESTLMIQPPVHEGMGRAAMMHYTWPSQLLWAANGSEAWSFEKRRISGAEAVMLLPKVPLPPPFVPGAWITPSAAAPKGRPTTQALYDTILLLIETINSGIDEVGGPKWRETLEGGGARPW